MANIELVLSSTDLLIVNGIKVTVSDGILEVKNGNTHFGLKCDRVVNDSVVKDIKVPEVTEFNGVPKVTKSNKVDFTNLPPFYPNMKTLHINGNLNEVKDLVKQYRRQAKSHGYRIRVYTRNKNRKNLVGKVSTKRGWKYSHDSLRRYVPHSHADRFCLYYFKN